jgi:eukaryotic-like serine/threonine-protein kinase
VAEASRKRTLAIPGFRIEKVLGKGAQGVVVKATRERDRRAVALKVLSLAMAKRSEFRQRFRREAAISMEIQHPNIVAGLEAGQAEGMPYVVFEFLDGETLADRIARGPMAEDEGLAICRQMADALACAHAHDLVHRDVKPENIMCGRDGTAKLMDLGLAKDTGDDGGDLTAMGSVFGTKGYISPEAAKDSKDVDIRSDIYSLGATLHHAVVGAVPFPAESLVAAVRRIVSEDPTPPRDRRPELSEAMSELLIRMLERRRVNRFQTPAELLAACDAVAAGDLPTVSERRALERAPARRGCLGWLFPRRG